jgi:hypothetical protein
MFSPTTAPTHWIFLKDWMGKITAMSAAVFSFYESIHKYVRLRMRTRCGAIARRISYKETQVKERRYAYPHMVRHGF